MKGQLLESGDVFRLKLKGGKKLVGRVADRKEGEEPLADMRRLTIGASYEGEVRCRWTEHAKGGWSRPRETVLDLRATGVDTARWLVTGTHFGGGGTAMGPHDVFPDGHGVTARRVDQPGSKEEVFFFQTGCFTCMADPDEIELVVS